ncbi:Uu.00g038960.m01.CDS01 [Anthostomella pinea]|uniref:Uu.00g038960.m01.CDS01 n=1 Tax=Anthostomella pinea TaxID=933095 RepID=A0AAI8VA13_9PEZI|nr:Uu.00g038960.m01.CDS01 [Anthostomella pinea]
MVSSAGSDYPVPKPKLTPSAPTPTPRSSQPARPKAPSTYSRAIGLIGPPRPAPTPASPFRSTRRTFESTWRGDNASSQSASESRSSSSGSRVTPLRPDYLSGSRVTPLRPNYSSSTPQAGTKRKATEVIDLTGDD